VRGLARVRDDLGKGRGRVLGLRMWGSPELEAGDWRRKTTDL
jgi:hypothetical protein